jgi:hypothetical protein
MKVLIAEGKRRAHWQVKCGHKHVGVFKSEVEAAMAYDAAAISRFGDFARLNFPAPGQRGIFDHTGAK